jgi:predicted nucleic acid-binding protein
LVIDSCVVYKAPKNNETGLQKWIAERRDRIFLVEPVVLEFLAGCENDAKQRAFDKFVAVFQQASLQAKDVDKAKAFLKHYRPQKAVAMDALIAAIAEKISALVVTYDIDDFQKIGCNPALPETNI